MDACNFAIAIGRFFFVVNVFFFYWKTSEANSLEITYSLKNSISGLSILYGICTFTRHILCGDQWLNSADKLDRFQSRNYLINYLLKISLFSLAPEMLFINPYWGVFLWFSLVSFWVQPDQLRLCILPVSIQAARAQIHELIVRGQPVRINQRAFN